MSSLTIPGAASTGASAAELASGAGHPGRGAGGPATPQPQRRPGRLAPADRATAVQLLDRLDPKPGEWMLVHGAAGGVGSVFVQLARVRGARVVAAASAQREPLLRELGAEVFVDRHAGQVAERACRVILTLHGVLVRPSRAVLEGLAAAVTDGSLRVAR